MSDDNHNPPPFAVGDSFCYVDGSPVMIVADVYHAVAHGHCAWVVVDRQGNRHYARNLVRAEKTGEAVTP